MHKILYIAMAVFLLAAVMPSYAAVSEARIITSTRTVTDIYYETGTTGSHTYIDRGNTPDATIEINGTADADVASKYIGGLYMINASNITNALYNLTTKNLGNPDPYSALVQTGDAYACGTGRSCANATYTTLSWVDTAVVDGYGIPVALSVYPANIWVVISDNQSIENGDTLVYVPTAKGRMKGSFTASTFESTYDQTVGDIRYDITSVTVNTASGTTQEIDSNYDDRAYIAVGVCEDDTGLNCNSTNMISKDSATVNLGTGITGPNDQSTATKYVVANGQGSSFCIGADAQVRTSDLTENVTTLYYNQAMEIKARIYNNRNVNITADTNLTLWIDGAMVKNWTVTETIGNYSTSNWYSYNWTASVTSGSHTINATADTSKEITECSETNNDHKDTVTVNKVFTPFIYINGTYGQNFSRIGVPHNVSIFLNDSDGSIQNNSEINITETNGISIFAPVQNWTGSVAPTRRGMKSTSVATVTTDKGWANFTLIPTGNPIYTDYPDYELGDYIGNYSFYMIGKTSGGTTLTFVIGGTVTTVWNLYTNNNTYDNTGFSNNQQYYQQSTYVQTVLDWVYEIFAMFRKLIIPV